jgi:hypothetical protein
MAAQMAQNLVGQKAAPWALNSVASTENQMAVQWELSTVAHSAGNWEWQMADC